MNIVVTEYVKDASMWNKVRTFSSPVENMESAKFILSTLGFNLTSYGEYFRQTAYNEAEGAVII